jgi:putative ABC transport system ATP-binding protein
MAEKTTTVLEFKDVVKEYSLGARKLQVLKGVSFRVHRGEFVSIMGPSGSGKSTMLQLMGCLDQASSGSVLVEGEDASRLSSNRLADLRARKIGFVFQAFNLLPNLTALQNVEVAMSINEVGKAERMKRAKHLLKVVGLEDREGHKPNELSGGEKQRVAVARALSNRPAFLLADEPTGNLDSKSGEEVMEFIHGLWRNDGLTIVMVTHEPVIAGFSQRIIHIRDGQVEREEKIYGVRKMTDLKTK